MPKPIYDRFAENYDKAFAPFERRFLAAWRKEALSLIPTGKNILEIGAGTGANFSFYPAHNFAAASEISSKMLKIAEGKIQARQISLVRANAQSLPFSDHSFDAAFATLVFCSIPEPGVAFDELRRVVKPGGTIVLLEHVRPRGVLGYAFDALNLLTVTLIEDHFNRRTAELAEKSGLKIVEVRSKVWGIVNLIICEVKSP